MQFPARASYTKSEINRIGEQIRTKDPSSREYEEAITMLNEWRVSHHYPMHTFNMTLRNKAYAIDRNAIIARRLKRRETIIDKITNRQKSMRLSAMQDIGGLRAIVQNVDQVYELVSIYTEKGRFPHKLKYMKDYIKGPPGPKTSGYRGIHLVFEFHNSQGRSKHARDYDGLLVELQLRSKLQHYWATAVETIGTIMHQELKSSDGDEAWLDFLALMSSVIAMLEDSPVLESHKGMTQHQIIQKTYKMIVSLSVREKLSGWAVGLDAAMRGSGRHYIIIALQPAEKYTTIYGYKENQLDLANLKREQLEREAAISGDPDPVLVSVGDVRNLKRAYPNYFLDIKDFLKIVDDIVHVAEG